MIHLSHVGRSCPAWCVKATSDIQVAMVEPWCCVRPSLRKAGERSGPGRLCALLVAKSFTRARGVRGEKVERAAGPVGERLPSNGEKRQTSHEGRCRGWRKGVRESMTEH